MMRPHDEAGRGVTGVADGEARELARRAVGVAAARYERRQQVRLPEGLAEVRAVAAQVAHQVAHARTYARVWMPQQLAQLCTPLKVRQANGRAVRAVNESILRLQHKPLVEFRTVCNARR